MVTFFTVVALTLMVICLTGGFFSFFPIPFDDKEGVPYKLWSWWVEPWSSVLLFAIGMIILIALG